ncbi:hypothetical protein BANRA_05678 [Klebsiella pneumoniae]|nr:hypothetical protein BANRA_05678 [Klebsiella pneumoniae]
MRLRIEETDTSLFRGPFAGGFQHFHGVSDRFRAPVCGGGDFILRQRRQNFGSQFGQFQHALNMTRTEPQQIANLRGVFPCSASVRNPAICSDGCIAICCSFSAIDAATASSSGTFSPSPDIRHRYGFHSAGAAALSGDDHRQPHHSDHPGGYARFCNRPMASMESAIEQTFSAG